MRACMHACERVCMHSCGSANISECVGMNQVLSYASGPFQLLTTPDPVIAFLFKRFGQRQHRSSIFTLTSAPKCLLSSVYFCAQSFRHFSRHKHHPRFTVSWKTWLPYIIHGWCNISKWNL